LPTAIPTASNYILKSLTDGTLSWIDPGTLPSSNNWNELNGTLYMKQPTEDLLIGGISSASATFHVYGQNKLTGGTTPVASVAGNTSFAGLVIDNKGKGDLFTASSSGLTRFTIAQDGAVTIRSSESAAFAVKNNNATTTYLSVDTINAIVSLLGSNNASNPNII